jgi:hypothetical protein
VKEIDQNTHNAQQWHNTKAHWGGAHTLDPTPMCLGVVPLLCTKSAMITPQTWNKRFKTKEKHEVEKEFNERLRF